MGMNQMMGVHRRGQENKGGIGRRTSGFQRGRAGLDNLGKKVGRIHVYFPSHARYVCRRTLL